MSCDSEEPPRYQCRVHHGEEGNLPLDMADGSLLRADFAWYFYKGKSGIVLSLPPCLQGESACVSTKNGHFLFLLCFARRTSCEENGAEAGLKSG